MSTVLEQLKKQQERNEADRKNAQKLMSAAAKATYQQGQQGSTLVEKATGGVYNNPSRKAYYQESKQAQKAEPKKQSIGKTVFDVVDRGAGYFNQGVASTVDFVANALPRVEGALTGEDPGATFTGAVLKPITDLTGKFKDKVDATVQAIDARVKNDTKDSKAAQVAADIGSGAIAAVPNAVLAFMSGGTSAATTLAPQTSGITATASAAARKMASSPMFKVSAIQSLGAGYDEAKANGASDAEAMVAATLSTAFNAAVESSGGLETLPGELRGADLSSTKKALQWLNSALDEGKEEVVQNVISGLTEKAVYNKDKALFSATDENAVVNPGRMAKEFGMGTAIGGIMGGGQMVGDLALNHWTKQPESTQVSTQTQFDAAAPKEDMVAKMAQDLSGQNKTAPTMEAEAESTSVNTDPAQHTPQEQALIEEYQAAVDQDLVDYYDGVENGNEKGFYPLKPVSDRAASDIQRITGNDVTGFKTRFDARQMFHVKNDHGANGKANQSMADSNDVGRIQYVLDNYDNVEPGGTTDAYWETKENGHNRRAKTVVFSKKVNGTYYVVEAAPVTKAKSLYVVSAYMENGAKNNGASSHLLDAEAPRTRPIPPNANNTPSRSIDANTENVNGSVGDMGAKTSDFKREVKQSQTAQNTIGQNEARWNIPEDARTDASYDAVTERESLNNARMRLEQDYEGEKEQLGRYATWSNEEVDMGMQILGDLRAQAKESGDWTAYKDWARVVKQHGVSTGQALQAWAKYTRRTGDGIMQTATELLGNARTGADVDAVLETVSDYADRFDSAVAGENVSDLMQIIRDTSVTRRTGSFFGNKLSNQMNWALDHVAQLAQTELDSGAPGKNYEFLRTFAAAGIENIAGDYQKVSFGERAKTFRYNAMLSKVSTVLRNLVGNGVFDPVDSVSRNISVPLDMLVSKLTGTRSVAADKSLFSKDKYTGSMDALAMALLETGLDVHSDGAGSKYERSANRTNKMAGGPLERLMSNWEKWMGYALTVTDETAKGGVSSEVQRGIDQLYDQGKITDDSLRDAGQQEAKYRTFQDDTQLSNALKSVRAAGNEIHVGDVGLGDIALPFAQVPANLASRALEYSPAGLAKSAVDLAGVLKKAKAGTLTAAEQAKAVQGIGRGINGTALIGLAATLALKGLIHVENPGDTDENKDKAAMDKASGFSGTQWNLSAMERWARGEDTAYRAGDEMISIGFLDPINAMLVTGALIAEDIQSEAASVGSVLKDSLSGTIQAVGDLPVMQTFKNIGNAFRYSDGDTWGEKAMDAGLQFAADQSASFIPNALKGVAQGLDPYQRDLYTGDTLGEKTLDSVKASIPGLRNTLPIKYDSFGNPMMNEVGVKNFLNTNILPGQVTTYKTNDTIEQLREAEKRTGKASVYPSSKAPKTITIDEEPITLSQEQKEQYQQFYGKLEEANRAALFADENYKALNTKMETKAHKYAEDFANQMAKANLDIGYEPDTWVTELEGASPEEIAKVCVGKALDSVGGYGDQTREDIYRKKIYDPAWSVMDGDVLDKAMEYATKFNDAVTKEEMGYEMSADWMEEAKAMGTQGRVDYFIGKAVEAQAKKVGGTKYEGLEMLLKSGDITGDAALLAMPDGAVDAYNKYCKDYMVSAEDWVDVYGYLNSLDGSGSENKERVLKYIESLKRSPKKKTALAQALYAASPDFIPKSSDIPNDWLLDIGADTSVIVGQFSESQKEAYSTYIEPAGVDMKHYLDAVEFNGSAKADKDKNGKTISGSKRDKVINHINSMDIDKAWKRAIYLSLGYSAKNMPRNWK